VNDGSYLDIIDRCLQHPYLVADDIEPRGLPLAEVHGKLIDASAKLRLLKGLLPKLKARGHRILLFSQVHFHALYLVSLTFTITSLL
jgi:chromodomain-helicase-DNA-binding protein 4